MYHCKNLNFTTSDQDCNCVTEMHGRNHDVTPLNHQSDQISGRIIARDVAMRTMAGEIVVQWWLLCKRQSVCGGGNCHGAEVF